LAAYLESEPERKKAALDAQKAKLAALDKQLGNKPGGTGDSQPQAGTKRRLDDTEFLEESQNLVDNVKSAVAQGQWFRGMAISSTMLITLQVYSSEERKQEWTLLQFRRVLRRRPSKLKGRQLPLPPQK
jgi:multidrug efflux pump subunit AcrA (membrane-fusion protein)